MGVAEAAETPKIILFSRKTNPTDTNLCGVCREVITLVTPGKQEADESESSLRN